MAEPTMDQLGLQYLTSALTRLREARMQVNQGAHVMPRHADALRIAVAAVDRAVATIADIPCI